MRIWQEIQAVLWQDHPALDPVAATSARLPLQNASRRGLEAVSRRVLWYCAQWGDFKSHHKSTRPIDVVAIEIDTDVAISFAHSQYVTHHIPIGFIATASSGGLVCDASG